MKILAISTSFVALLSLSGWVSGQNPIAYYSFDGCSLNDQTGTYNDATILNNLNCDCGVGQNSDAWYFNGSTDTMYLDNQLNGVFSGDFSLSFYFWTNPAIESMSLMSIRNACNRDSSLLVQYLPQSNEIIVEFSRNIAEGVFFRETLASNRCWHHIMFTKENTTFALYLDGEFVESTEFLSQLDLGPDYPFSVGYSPCVGITDQFFNGRIDEIRIHDYALKEDDLQADLLFPDEILTQDTTIFQGEQVQVFSGATCASNILWNPLIGIDNPNSTEPILSPEETTLYSLEFDHGSCVRIDTILVSVVSPEDIECSNLLFPKAFTPNNDGLNDEFGISNAFVVEQLSRFEIYNRWGMKLFETNNASDMWDGRYKGEFQMPGTYVYKVEYSCMGEAYKISGSFNILR